MNSSALACRPSTWSEVIGHTSVVNSLKNLIVQSTPVMVGFSGATGSGKTTLALILAAAIQPQYDPAVLDIRHINCADKNGVDDARELAEDSRLRPLTGDRKVYILDECHGMTPQAQNALLLPTEPKQTNPATLWILCTNDPQKMLPALRSRGAWYDLAPFGEAEIRQLYDRVSVQNLDDFPDELFAEVLKQHVTSPRDLLYALDKFRAGSPAEEAVNLANRNEVAYIEIAKAALKSWSATAALLHTLKPSDAKPLRITLASYMRAVLLNASGNRAQALCELLVRLGTQEAFEDTVSLAATTATLYLFTQKNV